MLQTNEWWATDTTVSYGLMFEWKHFVNEKTQNEKKKKWWRKAHTCRVCSWNRNIRLSVGRMVTAEKEKKNKNEGTEELATTSSRIWRKSIIIKLHNYRKTRWSLAQCHHLFRSICFPLASLRLRLCRIRVSFFFLRSVRVVMKLKKFVALQHSASVETCALIMCAHLFTNVSASSSSFDFILIRFSFGDFQFSELEMCVCASMFLSALECKMNINNKFTRRVHLHFDIFSYFFFFVSKEHFVSSKTIDGDSISISISFVIKMSFDASKIQHKRDTK